MKADLAKREPEMLAAWERDDIYGKIRKVAKGRPTFILTDGPPYANGALHLGHSLDRKTSPEGAPSVTTNPLFADGVVTHC